MPAEPPPIGGTRRKTSVCLGVQGTTKLESSRRIPVRVDDDMVPEATVGMQHLPANNVCSGASDPSADRKVQGPMEMRGRKPVYVGKR